MTGSVDVFVSYTAVDQAWAEWIAWQLERAGYSVFVQAWDILPGQDFVREMHRVSQQARRTMPVLSPAYLSSSEFGEAEWRVAFAADPGGQERRLVPVRVADCLPQGLLATRTYIDLVGLGQAEARSALLAGLNESGRPEHEPAFPASEAREEAAPRFPGALPPVFNVPARSGSPLEGREEDLAGLQERLAAAGPAGPVVVTGVGGAGKTRLLLEYAYAHVARFDVVWWVRGEEPITLLGDIAALAEAPGLPDPPPRMERGDTDEAVTAARGWLEHHDRWLLLIDNVEDPTLLRGLLPRGGGGQVLLTSRADVGWSGMAATLPLESLSEEAATRLLTQRSGDPDLASAQRLARRLGGLPLALEQAAGYVAGSGGMSIAGYLQLFDTRSSELFERGRPADRTDTVATTWSLTLDRLSQTVPAAVDLLVLLAHLALDEVPTILLAVHADRLPAELGEVVADPLRLADALGELRRYGMITASGANIGMHRVVQEVVRGRLDVEARGRWAAAAVQLLAAAFPGDVFDDPTTWDDAERLLPHALSSAAHAEHAEVAGAKASWLLDRAGSYLQARGQYRQAAGLLRRALAVGEAALGPDHPDIGTRRNNLGGVLQDLGDLTGARDQYERALAISEAALGPNHPDIGIWRNNLGGVLQDLGDHLLDRLSLEEDSGATHLPTAGRRVLDASLRRGEGVSAASRDLYLDGATSLQICAGYTLDVRIGQRSRQSLVVGDQPPVDPLLPDSRHGHDLELVIFPGAFELVGPRRRLLHLPPAGPSDLVSVEITSPIAAGEHRLRYGLYHKGNLIQTYRLTALVEPDEQRHDDTVLSIELDFTATAGWDNLDELTGRDLSLVLNSNGAGTHRVYAVADDASFDWDLPPGLQERLVAPLREELGRHVLAEDVDSDADGALRVLAEAGRTLLRALFDRVRGGTEAGAPSDQRRARQVMRRFAAASDQTLQIVRADAQQAIPWGLVYDWGLPARSGPVCWGVVDNTAAEPAPCTHTAKDKVVCVRGFWGVRHRIEELVDVGRDIDTSLPQAPAVDLAMGVDNSYSRGLRGDLARIVALSELGPADGLLDRMWQDATRPNVLAIVGHFDEALRAIECGTSEKHLSAEMITDRAFEDGDWQDPAPIVLLLACESGAVTPSDVTSHLLALMAVGAAAIVATECVVKTSHVQAFTAEFLGALLTSDPSPPGMAAAVQRVRKALLADRRLLPVLAFTAFGSADLHAVAS